MSNDLSLTITPPTFAGYQKDFLYNPHRYTVVEASTKTGKTFSMIFWLYEQAHGLENGKEIRKVRPGNHFWWVAPTYAQAKIAFNRLWRIVAKSGLYKQNKADLTITTPLQTVIEFKTAKDPNNLYGEDVFCAVFDEFTRASKEAWFALRSTLTATKGKCKFIGNYKGNSNWGHQLGEKSKTDPEYSYHKVTAYDAVEAGILSKEEVEQAKRDLPDYMFKALYLAEGSLDLARLISDAKIKDLLTNTYVKATGKRYLTADLAFQGSDLFVIFIWDGLRIIGYKVIAKSTGLEIEKTIKELAEQYQVPRSNIAYDADGVGMFLEGYLKDAYSFKVRNTPIKIKNQKVEYADLKSQCEFELANHIEKGLIYFDCDISEYWDLIIEELECIKNRDLDKQGKLETLRKPEIKLLIGRSPDFKDALMMRMVFEIGDKPADLGSLNLDRLNDVVSPNDKIRELLS